MGTIYMAWTGAGDFVKKCIIFRNNRMLFIWFFFFVSCIAIIQILNQFSSFQNIY